ncbi:hypothetical protein [Streptomyces sp. F63]|uniref:hypothetical protein n=1 Tax=Streptomyces sp. F63 TaxID=2824887 RepID=UPI0027DD7124|nr:hypothetical protein [Streptomyces sp. F63]
MRAALEGVLRGACEVGALGSSDDGARFCAGRGRRRWTGPTFALTPDGAVRTAEEDGCIHVFPVSAPLELPGDLVCDRRDGDVW